MHPPTPLWLVRHAPTAAPSGQVVGHLDVDLSEAGHAAVQVFAEACEAIWPVPPAHLVSSDLARARATAAPLAAHWGLTPHVDARLREVHFGRWEGATWDALEREDPAALTAWMTDWVNTPPPGGESFQALRARVETWVDDWKREARGPTLVVAHAGSIRALLCASLGLPSSAAFGFAVEPLHVTRLDAHPPGTWTLSQHGVQPHS